MFSARKPVTPQLQDILPVSSSASSFHYFAISGKDVTQDLLQKCAELFSAHYGVYGDKAATASPRRLPGKRVKMSASWLRKECLSAPESTILVTCFKRDVLVGHAFATVWNFDGGVAGWITQLVVDGAVRGRYIATHLLQTLKSHQLLRNITAIGLASSHPASVNALAKYSNVRMDRVDTGFISKNAKNILATTPVNYLKAELHGSLFEDNCNTGAVSCVDTKFYVDHRVPLEVLDTYKKDGRWPLGELFEGHEFLIIVPVEKSPDV